MTIIRRPCLITPSQLKALRPSTYIPIDASWHMPGSPSSGVENYSKERIPRARFFDLDLVSSPHPMGLKHMLPTAETFALHVSKLGIKPDDRVVLYDTHGLFSAARAAFTFQAFNHTGDIEILAGGLPRWKAEGHELEHGQPEVFETTAYLTPNEPSPPVTKTYEEMVENSLLKGDELSIVLDARPHPRFTGKAPEPRPGLPSGHIPQSLSLPFPELVRDGTLLPEEELEAKLKSLLGPSAFEAARKGSTSVIATCGSGMTAGVIWLALQRLGIESTIYDESWTGYAQRKESVIARGE